MSQDRKFTRLKNLAILLLIFIALIAVGVVFASNFVTERDSNETHIVITEMMLSNKNAHPTSDGNFYDWVELYNGTDQDVSLAGYGLSDNDSTIKFYFPKNTVLRKGEYLVVYCDASLANVGGMHAPFGLSRDGGEKVILVNTGGKIIEEIKTVPCGSNQSYARKADGKWEVTPSYTPGYENSDAGREAFLSSMNGEELAWSVKISEICAKNLSCFVDGNKNTSDWIELYNDGKVDADLTGCWLSNESTLLFNWQFPSLVLKPGERVIVFCSDAVWSDAIDGEMHTPFKLKAHPRQRHPHQPPRHCNRQSVIRRTARRLQLRPHAGRKIYLHFKNLPRL